MKILLLLCFILPTVTWLTDFNKAKIIAKEDNKLILLNFSGSDWCGPCIKLKRDYFGSQTFMDMASEKLVLVNADFPRKKKNMADPAQIKANEALAEIYNKEGGFPLTLLLDADGKVLKKWDGLPFVTVDEWTKEVSAYCNLRI